MSYFVSARRNILRMGEEKAYMDERKARTIDEGTQTNGRKACTGEESVPMDKERRTREKGSSAWHEWAKRGKLRLKKGQVCHVMK